MWWARVWAAGPAPAHIPAAWLPDLCVQQDDWPWLPHAAAESNRPPPGVPTEPSQVPTKSPALQREQLRSLLAAVGGRSSFMWQQKPGHRDVRSLCREERKGLPLTHTEGGPQREQRLGHGSETQAARERVWELPHDRGETVSEETPREEPQGENGWGEGHGGPPQQTWAGQHGVGADMGFFTALGTSGGWCEAQESTTGHPEEDGIPQESGCQCEPAAPRESQDEPARATPVPGTRGHGPGPRGAPGPRQKSQSR